MCNDFLDTTNDQDDEDGRWIYPVLEFLWDEIQTTEPTRCGRVDEHRGQGTLEHPCNSGLLLVRTHCGAG